MAWWLNKGEYSKVGFSKSTVYFRINLYTFENKHPVDNVVTLF